MCRFYRFLVEAHYAKEEALHPAQAVCVSDQSLTNFLDAGIRYFGGINNVAGMNIHAIDNAGEPQGVIVTV